MSSIQIPLQEFVLQIPKVNRLDVKPVGSPLVADLGAGPMILQPVYYELLTADKRVVEKGNKDIPMNIYNLVQSYILGRITPADIETINQFFQYVDWPLTAILPPDQEPLPEPDPEPEPPIQSGPEVPAEPEIPYEPEPEPEPEAPQDPEPTEPVEPGPEVPAEPEIPTNPQPEPEQPEEQDNGQDGPGSNEEQPQ